VIDDNLTARTIAEVLLTAYGRCDAAQDGEDGLALFRAAHEAGDPYGLVTVDIQLPGMAGQEVVKAIRRHEEERGVAEAKVVMVTGMDDLENMSSSFWQGCQGYLVKPLTAQNLQATMEHLYIEPLERSA
jgi:two-component system chemotaxis response regulator CheY